MDEEDIGDGVVKSPIKRLGSTRKVLAFNNIRVQLGEQLRCLDVRMESQVALVAELQDFFRRRAEVELDYSKNLDKLSKSLHLRHKEQKQKREQWPLFSSYSCWQQLVTQTRNLSKDHAALSEVYSTHLTSRLGQVIEDVQRIYRRCREIGYETHEEILRVLHELHTTMKTYHSYQGECRQAETKLRLAENQRLKIEQSTPKEKLDRSKKFRLIEKEVQKRKNKYNDAKLKALKARNEYTLCLEASNTTIHKYFVDDLSDLIDCMDFGFHNCITRALLMHVSAEEGQQRTVQSGIDQMNNCINSLDSRLDKQRFLEFNHSAFMIPKKFEFQGQRDEGPENDLQKCLRADLENRLGQLQNRVTTLRTESEEVWKTLETAEITLLDMLNAKDYDCTSYFGESGVSASKPPETVSIKLRADRQETEEFYMSKFREYLLGTSRIARLDSKHEHIRLTLIDPSGDSPSSLKGLHKRSGHIKKPPRRKRIGRLQMSGQTKLFGGSLEEYLESTNEEIPLIIKSCVRVINLYGLHHQGIFRVSGSQLEINNFRESFERGEDPLADMTDASDINSVAGVLKLYLRELREPLFPIIYFEQFMELAQLESKHDFVVKLKDLILSLPRSFIVVLRYLFAFLNHLSEYSDENMMDPYNLAICFGPTLVPVPEDKDQVQYQNQVNELIKNIILFNEDIFPLDGGLLYEKYISKEPDENDVGDSPSEHLPEDGDSEVYPSEDESENMEATVQFDFLARSERELSLKKGDHVTLFSQVSNDWWRGSANGHEGLIPDKYILLKMKDEDRDKLELLKSSSSEESMRRRASSSNDSILSSGTSSSPHNSPLVGIGTPVWPDPEMTRRALVGAEPTPLIMIPTSQELNLSSSPRSSLKKSSLSLDSTLSDSSSKSSACSRAMGVVETALSTAQLLATAALHAEVHAASAKSEEEEDRLSEFLDSLPGNESKGDLRSSTPVSTSSGEGDRESRDITSKEQRYSSNRKAHWKSQSVGEVAIQLDEDSSDNSSFSQNRDLWKLRALSQSQLESDKKEKKSFRSNQEFWELRQKHTPDLVMGLPVLGSSSPKDGTESLASLSSSSSSSGEDEVSVSDAIVSPPGSGPESPDMTTAAERFAKQNQCTLKKNTKTAHGVSIDAQTQTIKGSAKRSKYTTPETSDGNDLSNSSKISNDHNNETLSSDSVVDLQPLSMQSPGPQRTTPKFATKFVHNVGTHVEPLPLQSEGPSPLKPQVKAKPQILRKPVLPLSLAPQQSPELGRKEKTNESFD